MNTKFRYFRWLLNIIGIVLLLGVILPKTIVFGQLPPFPSGYTLKDSKPGVELYTDGVSGSPDYIQVVHLNQGASITLPYGAIYDPGTNGGVWGGNKPSFNRQSLQTFWYNFSQSDPKAFCITNGEFFADFNANGTLITYPTLAFSLKVNNNYTSDGYAVAGIQEEYPNTTYKLMLEIWPDRVDIKQLTKDNFYNSTAPNIIGGLDPQAQKEPTYLIGRTIIGISDPNGDGTYKTLYVLNGSKISQTDAVNALTNIVGQGNVMMLDGGSSTQLICRDQQQPLISSWKTVPQAFAVSYSQSAVSMTNVPTPSPATYSCPKQGHVGFENFNEGVNLSLGTIAGMHFETTNGYTWLVGDFNSHNYNGKYPNGGYTSDGTHWAWLGIYQGAGKISFVKGPASYISLLTSNATPVSLDAYDSNNNVIATAGPAPSNYNTGNMEELKIFRANPDIAYVKVHDTGNYFLIDDVCTDAPGTPNSINQIVDQTYYLQTGQSALGYFLINFINGAKHYIHILVGPYFSDVDLKLTRPDGSIVSPSDPGVTYNKTANQIEVSIDNAQTGQWGYEIIANQLDAGGENIHIGVDDETIPIQSPTISIPGDQTVQYSDSLSFGVSASDPDSTYKLALSASSLPDGLTFIDNGDSTGTVSGLVTAGPGSYPVQFTVTDPNGLTDTKSLTINVTPEDARVTYTGPAMVSTSCATCTSAIIPLRTTVQDITAVDPSSDPYPGDITKAIVTFVNRDNANSVLCTATPVLLNLADSKTATATCNWTVDIGSSTGQDFTVGTIIDGYYTRNSSTDDTVVVVYLPTPNFITGGGYIINQSSSGTYAGDANQKTNFGLNLKFTKNLSSLQGRVNIITLQGSHTYQIKTTSLSSLVVKPGIGTTPPSAELLAKANIQDITDPANPISLVGGATIDVIFKDYGEPGTNDTINITVWGKNNALLFSSNWTGKKSVDQKLDGGNIHIYLDQVNSTNAFEIVGVPNPFVYLPLVGIK